MSPLHQAFESGARLLLAMVLLTCMQPAIASHGLPFRLATSFIEFKPLQLDASERQWLASHPTLRVGIALGDYEPVDITNDRDYYQGLSADYLGLVRDRLGVSIELLGYKKRDQAVAELLAGKIDILTSASGFERGIEGIAFSRSYMVDQGVIVGRTSDFEPITRWAGKKIGFVDGYVDVQTRYPELLGIMNKALEAIPVAEFRTLRTRWLGGVGQPLVIERGLYHSAWLYWAIGALFAAGLMLFTWNRLLRRQLGIGRQFEQTLREEVERNRRFLDGIPSPIFVVGLEGELLTCNKSYEERLSVQLEQIRGLKVTDVNLFPEELAEQFQQELMRMIHSRKPCYKKRWVEFKAGGMEIYQWTVPFYSVSGRLEGLVGGWFDTSESRKWN